MTNLCQCRDSVGHELITHFLVSVTQLSLNILFGIKYDGWVSVCVCKITFIVWWSREQSEAASSKSTYGATEREEGLDQLILWEEGVPCHQIDESAQSTSPPLNELALRDRRQDCRQTSEGENIYGVMLVRQRCTLRGPEAVWAKCNKSRMN